MKKVQKKSKKSCSVLLLKGGIALLCVYLIVALVMSQVEIMIKRQQIEALDTAITRQEAENQELQRLLTSGDEDEYIERIARDKYGYASPQERIFIDIQGK
ncbi:MAG: septum formation initiator family protein [Oscillospiraceae bacterium]|nr:septum formation initiator family protein [Oscillospiraceae bacterium]